MAPGVKFGRLGGNRALNNESFRAQVYESGSSNNQVKIGQRLAKTYEGKLLAKLQKASAQMTISEDDYNEVSLNMPPLKEIRVKLNN